jgi:hypothetical protein
MKDIRPIAEYRWAALEICRHAGPWRQGCVEPNPHGYGVHRILIDERAVAARDRRGLSRSVTLGWNDLSRIGT